MEEIKQWSAREWLEHLEIHWRYDGTQTQDEEAGHQGGDTRNNAKGNIAVRSLRVSTMSTSFVQSVWPNPFLPH